MPEASSVPYSFFSIFSPLLVPVIASELYFLYKRVVNNDISVPAVDILP